MLDFLFRRGNPTNHWIRTPNLTLTIELLVPSINGVPIGNRVSDFSFLGRSSSKEKSCLEFRDLGLSLDHEDDGTCSGFQIVIEDKQQEFERFSGTITLNGSVIDSSNLTNQLGNLYWTDRDEDEAIFFHEFPNHEVQIEQTPGGRTQRIIVTNQPLMAKSQERASYGVDKDWPPQMN